MTKTGTLRASKPKYDTVAKVSEKLEAAGFETVDIETDGESSLKNGLLGFKKHYADTEEFTEKAHNEYSKENYANIDGAGFELDWNESRFVLKKDNCRIILTIAGANGSVEPVLAYWKIEGEENAEAEAVLNAFADRGGMNNE